MVAELYDPNDEYDTDHTEVYDQLIELDFSKAVVREATSSLSHIGVEKKSGRYPWGSGENPEQRLRSFLGTAEKLRKDGLTESQVAEGLGINTAQLRARKSIAKNEIKAADISKASMLREKGLSNVAIGAKMNPPMNESSVRALLAPETAAKADILQSTASMLRESIDRKGVIQIGSGVEAHIGVSPEKLNTAVAILHEDGYKTFYVDVPQLGTGKMTNLKVLAPPGVGYAEIMKDPSKIANIDMYTPDGGRTMVQIVPPKSVDLKRVGVRYAEQGGSDMDGVIQVRRGVDDVSLGNNKYAQVRIAVDGTHYLKGMAMYADDLPDGVDLMFNTNKSDKGDKLKAMKPMKTKGKDDDSIDEENPFGSSIKRQMRYLDKDGKEQLSPMNIVNEEGDWGQWSKSLSSQALSKQTPQLAKQQLDLKFASKQAEFDEINSLTNPAVKKKLLESFADDADSSAVHLKAAALPRQKTQVILPINAMKDNEVYAPQFRDGEKVVLIRYPHGGIFEIPELTVNNKVPAAAKVMKQATDAIGINARVAERLSGADFDGDTVLVIPNNNQSIKTAPRLKELIGFDPQKAYPRYEGMPKMSPKTKQLKMGDVSNLITDMTVKGASHAELARAVKHSMVVIDAEKHDLNWKQSAKDNGIAELKLKYQGASNGGAATLISRASSTTNINERKARRAADGGPIDAATGKKMFYETGKGYEKTTVRKDGTTKIEWIAAKEKSTNMADTDDARTLIGKDPTIMESVYAEHANRLKSLANQSRKAMIETPNVKYNPSAKVAFDPQVKRLKAALNTALQNKPLEREAQLTANAIVTAKRQANPDMDAADLKKIKGQALNEARLRVGATKQRIEISDMEWTAIQAGAISNAFLNQILANTDVDRIKELATPRDRTSMTPGQVTRAKAMIKNGYDQAEIADMLAIPASTLNDTLRSE